MIATIEPAAPEVTSLDTLAPTSLDELTPTSLDALAPISLDELVARASLLTRLDRKYLLTTADLPSVLAQLPTATRILQIDDRRDFGYRSDYFDTPELDSYRSAATRRRRRFKTRVRTYLDSGTSFLEIKTRGQRGTTVKQRLPHPGGYQDFGLQARHDTGAILAAAGISCDPFRLELALVTTYRRTTLFLPDTGSRATIDTELTWALPDGSTLRAPDRVIVETKSAGAASELDRVLWGQHRRPVAVSKYATGLAALRPELGSNRWHPVLRKHFHPSTVEGTS